MNTDNECLFFSFCSCISVVLFSVVDVILLCYLAVPLTSSRSWIDGDPFLLAFEREIKERRRKKKKYTQHMRIELLNVGTIVM